MLTADRSQHKHKQKTSEVIIKSEVTPAKELNKDSFPKMITRNQKCDLPAGCEENHNPLISNPQPEYTNYGKDDFYYWLSTHSRALPYEPVKLEPDLPMFRDYYVENY